MSSDEIVIGDTVYISSKRAATITSYTQDYIGQLARSNLIAAQRVGGLWYVSEQSLKDHKSSADEYKPEPPAMHTKHSSDRDSFVALDGRDYISATRASEISGYNRDYVGQLARSGTILARQVGNRWYVEKESLLEHKREKDAMLAAVQAQSVGLDLGSHIRESSASPDRETSTLMNYVPQQGHLTPPIESKEESPPTIVEVPEVPRAVPIRVVRREVYRENDVHRHKMWIPLPLVGALATVLIIVSIGFVSIRSQSLYTTGSDENVASLAALVAQVSGQWGDFLEALVVKEIRYHRK